MTAEHATVTAVVAAAVAVLESADLALATGRGAARAIARGTTAAIETEPLEALARRCHLAMASFMRCAFGPAALMLQRSHLRLCLLLFGQPAFNAHARARDSEGCQNYMTPQGCLNGTACRFIHPNVGRGRPSETLCEFYMLPTGW